MNLRHHRIPDEVFAALAAGSDGVHAVAQLTAAQYSKHVLLVRGIVDRAAATGHADAVRVRHAYDLLADVQEQAPAAVDAVLRHPSVGAWARRTLQALMNDRTRAAAKPSQLAALAAAAAIRARAAWSVRVPVLDGAVMLPSLGRANLGPGDREALVRSSGHGAVLIAGTRRVEVPANPSVDAPGWQGLRDLTAAAGGRRIRLIIDDLDPYRMPAANGLGDRLATHEVETWRSTFQAAWSLLVRRHWTTADEIGAAIRVLTPLAWSPSGQVSASSRETYGCVALSSPSDARTFAVTLAHEVQHAKLAGLLDLVRLIRPDDERRYYAPWRDDPRPLGGLLQGAYAYLGVTGFWRRQRHHENGHDALHGQTEFARWRAATDMVVETLANSDQLTPAGKTFVAGMADTLRSWSAESVPVAALTIARRKAERHRARWRLHNGELSEPYANLCP